MADETYTFVCTVSVRRSGKRLVGFETTVSISVDDPAEENPLVAVKRPAQQMPLFAIDGEGLRIAAGSLNVAVTSKGAISAKYSGTEGKSISFSGNRGGRFAFDRETVRLTRNRWIGIIICLEKL